MTDADFSSKTSQIKAREDDVDEVSQGENPGLAEAGGLPPDEGGALSPQRQAGGDSEAFFAFIRQKHLDEAQEFRRQGYNSRVPGVDPGLLPQLREAADVASRLVHLHASGQRRSWLLAQLRQIEGFIQRLPERVMQAWVNEALAKERLVAGGPDAPLNRHAAQSLVRRLESTLQTLTRVAHALGLVVDYSTPENLQGAVREELVAGLTDAIAPGDREGVTQALGRMTADAAGSAAWSGLMDTRVAAREASRAATFDAVIAAARREAEKASQKARSLSGSAQAFFSDMAAFLLRLSGELRAERSASGQDAVAGLTEDAQDEQTAARREGLKGLSRKLSTRVRQGRIRLGIVGTTVSRYGRGAARVVQHGETTVPPSKTAGRDVADSITRSLLWQWQQPAIKLQHASGAILAKAAELKKIQGLFAGDAADAGERGDVPAGEPGDDDVDAQVRRWVNERMALEQPGGQRGAKLAVLSQLLDGDIASARGLVARLGNTREGIENMLKRQRAAVLNMVYGRRSATPDGGLKAVNALLPEIAGALADTVAALEEALQAAGRPARDFSAARTRAQEAQLLATKARESISTRSMWLTGRPLDDHSRGTRLARHWASLAGEQHPGGREVPDARGVLASLKSQGLLEATLSRGDPEGYLFATRLAGELENARHDELKLPMSPDEYVALEKSLVEFIVSWGQKRVARGGARLVVELSFEQAVDTVTFGLSSLLRVPYKVLKASVKIPYRVNKVNNYTMPGQDRPYKAMYALLGKKLKQLGFNLLTAPVPGVIKLPIGAGIAAGAALYNQRQESKEKTFSAVYERVAQGRKSEKIKMGGLSGMLLDGGVDAGVIGGVKGIRQAGGRLPSEAVIPEEINRQLIPPTEAGETLTPLSAEAELLRIMNTGEPELRTLAARLLMQPDIDRVPLWRSDLSGHSRYSVSGRWIKLGADASDWEIMHEITHGLTADKLRHGLAHPGSELGRRVAELDVLRQNALASYQGEDPQTQYYLSHLDEFVAGLYSGNHDFIDHLQVLDKEGRSLLRRVIEGICYLLGLLPEQESALSRAMGLTGEIMQAPSVTPEGDAAGELNYSPPGTSSKIGVGNSRQPPPARQQTSTAGSVVDWQTFNGKKTSSPSQRDALVGWLAALTPQVRRAWFSSRSLTLDPGFAADLKIYLAEWYFIYDDPVSGADYFAWVRQFKQWPAAFQRDNRVVGILRDVRSPADFPAGKGFLFTLRDDAGGVLFSKKYFPDTRVANGNKSGLWHQNILEQIARDMNKLPADQRVSVSHITNQSYDTRQPVLSQGITAHQGRNIFIAAPDSQVATADFRFIDASENVVPILAELEAQEDESQPQPRQEQSDPLVGAGTVSDYFLGKDNVSADVRQDTLVWTTITGSNIDPDERNEAYNAFVYLWQPGKPGRIRVTVGQYLNDDAYVDSKYQMMILPRDYSFADENSVPTENDRRWPTLETLYRSRHIRQLHQKIFAETSDDDSGEVSSRGESEQVAEGKTHTLGTKSWETDNQQRFSLQGERDLVAGEKILVSVTDAQGLVEYIEIPVPAERVSRHRWPAYVAAKINSEMKFARVGDSAGQGQAASIGVKTRGENYLWTTNGQVVEWQILRGGTAAALPAEDNARWRVPASDTWATTPPRLALPRPASTDERLVIWVEDKKSGALIERLEVPALQEPNEKALSQAINQSTSHLRVGERSEGEIVPTDDPGGNIFWVDNDNYVVKYALVPAESLDKSLQLTQRYHLLRKINNNPTETRAFLTSGKHHPYTALDRTEINKLLTLPQSDVPGELIKLHTAISEAGLSIPQVIANEQWVDSEKNLINDSVSYIASHPLSGSEAENKSFVKAKTDALRYFLHQYPTLAEGTGISATTVDQHQLLAAVNVIYDKMNPEQQNDFIFVTALNWKQATDASFSSRILSLTSAPTLELFGLREEVITDYETAVSKEIFVNADSKTANFKSRDESSSDEAYFKQFADYIKDNLSDEAKRMSRFQMSQSGLSSFDMNRPVAKSVKITMEVPVYVQNGLQRLFREKPATGDIHLFKTDSGRYFIYSSVGESVFLQEVKDNFSETELTNMLNGRIDEAVKIKLEALFRQKIPLDDVSTQGGYGSFNSTKRPSEGSSLNDYKFSAQVESPQDLQAKLATANSAYLRRAIDQYREQQFTLNNWEKFRDAIIPFYKRWSRSSKDPTYEHSDEDAYNDLMSLFGLFSVVGGGSGGAAKAFRSLMSVLRSGRPATARAMLSLLVRGAQAAAPGLREALQGMAVQLASEMFPPLDLARAARAGVRYVRGAIGRTGGISGLRNIAEGSGQPMVSRNPFSVQNSVSVDLSDAARYQPSGYNSVNAPNNLYIKDGQIYLQRSDGVFELDATHGGRTLRVRVPGQTPHTGPEIIHTSNGFIGKGPSGLGGGKNGGSRIPLGDNRGQPIRGTLGRERYGQDNRLSKPRTDLTPEGTWPGTRPTLSEVYDETKALDKRRNYKSLNAETKANTKVVTDKVDDIFHDYVTNNPIPLDAEGKPKFTVSAIGFGSLAREELLLVSDIDLQFIVVARDAHAAEARAYAQAMMNNVKSEWSKVRKSVNSHPDATALEVDSVGGVEGVIVVDSAEKAAGLMKPTKMGAKGYSDTYADSRAIYESKPGTYQTMFEGYEAKLQNTEVNGLVNEALSDLSALPPTLSSAKQTFIRPITLAVGGLYRKLRAKLGTRLPYETNTLKRAQMLKEHGLIDEVAYQNIEEVLLRSFKWEQEAGLESFKHGQQVLPKRASSSSTRGMYNKTRQIKLSLSSANDKINRMPAPPSPPVVRPIAPDPDNGSGSRLSSERQGTSGDGGVTLAGKASVEGPLLFDLEPQSGTPKTASGVQAESSDRVYPLGNEGGVNRPPSPQQDQPFGPDSYIEMGPNNNTVIIRAHGYPGDTGHYTAEGVATVIRDYLDARGISLKDIRHIELQSCYGNTLGPFSQAQAIANKLQVRVKGYSGKFTPARGLDPGDGAFSQPYRNPVTSAVSNAGNTAAFHVSEAVLSIRRRLGVGGPSSTRAGSTATYSLTPASGNSRSSAGGRIRGRRGGRGQTVIPNGFNVMSLGRSTAGDTAQTGNAATRYIDGFTGTGANRPATRPIVPTDRSTFKPGSSAHEAGEPLMTGHDLTSTRPVTDAFGQVFLRLMQDIPTHSNAKAGLLIGGMLLLGGVGLYAGKLDYDADEARSALESAENNLSDLKKIMDSDDPAAQSELQTILRHYFGNENLSSEDIEGLIVFIRQVRTTANNAELRQLVSGTLPDRFSGDVPAVFSRLSPQWILGFYMHIFGENQEDGDKITIPGGNVVPLGGTPRES
jgi:hypothetical protein